LRHSLDGSDRLVVRKNQEISELNSRLATKDETIAELGEQIDRLECELATRPTQSETSATVVEAADLLNQLKADRKKSRANLGDIEAVLRLLMGISGSIS
jgi:uncharacterized coiled-coil DUF342 family protein